MKIESFIHLNSGSQAYGTEKNHLRNLSKYRFLGPMPDHLNSGSRIWNLYFDKTSK